MKVIKASLELHVPNSVASRAKQSGIVIYQDGSDILVKVGDYKVDKRKTKVDIEISQNGIKKD